MLHNSITLLLQSTAVRIEKIQTWIFKKNFEFTLLNSIISKLDFGNFQRQNTPPGTWIPL